MSNLRVLDAVAADKYLKASGAGSDVDPHIPQHSETNSAAILAAAEAIQTAAAAIQAAVETLDNVVAGSEAQVDVVTMPSTAVTGPLTDTELRASAVPVSGTVTASGPLTDVQLRASAVPVSAAALPIPTGASTAANQATIIGHVDGIEALLTTVDSDTSTLAVVGGGLEATALRVTLASDSTGVVSVDDNGGALTVDGTVAVTNAALTALGSAISTELQVDVVGSLPAGTNAIGKLAANSGVDIGDVDVASIAAGTNTIGATRDAGPSWTTAFGVSGAVVTSADASTATAVTDAPTGGQKLVITDIVLSVGATAMQCDLEEETSGTVLLTMYMAANSTVQITPRSRLKLATADKKLMLDTSAAGAVSCTVWYHSEA